jgi:hypothetical protein
LPNLHNVNFLDKKEEVNIDGQDKQDSENLVETSFRVLSEDEWTRNLSALCKSERSLTLALMPRVDEDNVP